MKVTLEHLHSITGFTTRPGFCHGGTRELAKALGLDWNEFRKNGMEADVLRATKNPLALALVAHAEKMEADRGRS